LDVLSVVGLFVLFGACLVALWEMPKRLPDGGPAPIYRLIGMLPRQVRAERDMRAEAASAPHSAAV
jgi:hypothetical protein